MSKNELLEKAKARWNGLSEEKKNKYKDELNLIKKKYISEYKAFLNVITVLLEFF